MQSISLLATPPWLPLPVSKQASTSYLQDREAVERRGHEVFEGHDLVLEIDSSHGESDARCLGAAGQSEVVQHGRHLAGGGGGALICRKYIRESDGLGWGWVEAGSPNDTTNY